MKSYGSANIKISLLITGVIIIISTLLYTQLLVREILERERDIANLYAKSIEFIANDDSQSGEYSFVFNNVINSRSINFPIVVTDAKSKLPTFTKNLDIDTSLPRNKQLSIINEMIKEMDEVNSPIKVTFQDSIELSYVHYGQSDLVTKLQTLPIIQFIVAGIFILLGYFGFNYIKRTEQSNIWVGLSRETAHQLGTPLSSLLGWNELLKSNITNPAKVSSIAHEMSNDLDRLSKIANRFSKIGSRPELRNENVYEIIQRVVSYFEIRIPRISTGSFDSGKKINIIVNGDRDARAMINRELFEWVIENLTKNALDAIENSEGSIIFNIERKGKQIFIDITDTGKGIDLRFRKDIFRPGYSTKTRGWGLGLTLSKRIIEMYHKGKLFIKESEPGKGTTFRIKLTQIENT